MPLFDPSEKPDEKRFDQVAGYLTRQWRDGIVSAGVAESLFFRTVNIWAKLEEDRPTLKGKRPNYHSGSATSLVEHAVDAHLAFDPRFSRFAPNDTDPSRLSSDKVEKTMQVIYDDAIASATNIPTKVNGKGLVLYNYTVLGTMLRPKQPEKPKRKRGQSKEDFEMELWDWIANKGSYEPIELIVPSIGEVLMDPTTTNPDIAIWNRTMKAWELADLTTRKVALFGGDAFDMGRMDAEEDIKIQEWWSPRHISIRRPQAGSRRGKQFFVEPNKWGVQPFNHIFGGTQISPANGEHNLRDWIEQSILFRVKETIIMEWQAIAAHHNSLMRTAFARYGSEMDSSEAAEQLEADILQGEADQWWIENTPQLGAQTFQHLETLKRSEEEDTYSKLAAGFRQAGVDTATGMIILSEATNRAFKANVTKMGDLYGHSAQIAMKLLYRQGKEFGKAPAFDYTVIGRGEHSFTIADLEENFNMKAKFEQVDAVVAQQEKQEAREELSLGLISRARYHKIARIEDATGLEDEIIDDLVTQDKEYKAELVIVALRNKEMTLLADRKEAELKALRAQGANPTVGPDEVPTSTNGTGGA